MCNYYCILFLAPLFFLSYHLKAQDSSSSSILLQQQLESIAENSQNEENDYTQLLEMMNHYSIHRINLNKTSYEELQQLRLLNDIQINNLLSHIEKNGKLISIYELQTIDGFNTTTIQTILPYVYVADYRSSSPITLKEAVNNGQHVWILRYGQVLEQQKGFSPIDSASLVKSTNARYIGSPQKLYTRYRFNYNNQLQWGITAEKDQGELFFKNKQRFKYTRNEPSLNNKQYSGFDFYSAHAFVNNVGIFKAIALGDYRVSFGQGLTVWNGFSLNTGYNALQAKRVASGLRPYQSVDENNFLRGAATTLYYKHFEATAFISHKKTDGNISDTSANGEPITVSSLQSSGYHSTLGELYDKGALTQTITGGNVSYKTRQLSLGITALNYLLSKPLSPQINYYNQFQFSGTHNINMGVDYNIVLRNFNFFGEQSLGKNGGMAFLNGVLIYLNERISLTVLHRYYQPRYQNLMSNAFGQNTINANEKGVYTGVVLHPFKNFTLYAYYDRVEFPWLKYQVNAPSYGNELQTQLIYTPSKKTEVYIRIRYQQKQKNEKENTVIDFPSSQEQLNYRFNVSYTILPTLHLRNRIEWIHRRLPGSQYNEGFMVYQDIRYKALGKPYSFALRYALFETDGYDARIYAYENDMPSTFSIPAYYDRGSRFYLLMNYRFNRNIELWLRYAQTYYDNKKVISEGTLSEILGHTRSEIKAQVVWSF